MANEIQAIPFGNERMAIFTFYDPRNRNMSVTQKHMEYHREMNIPINYIEIDYRRINHGGAMESMIQATSHQIEYYVFLDNDALILKSDGPRVIFDKLRDKNTVFGGAQNSNHINVNPTHPFVQPSTFCISASLYRKLGSPRLSDGINHRSDTCEEATWLCEEEGRNVCLIWPKHYFSLTDEESKSSGNPKAWKLTDKIYYGLGTTYGDMFFHAGMQSLPRSAEVFINKANEVLNPKVEAVIVCVGYSKFLNETLPHNLSKFDNIVVVTTFNDTETSQLCEKLGVTCVKTNRFFDNGATFDKGSAINEGLKKLKYNQWVCHLDCDIALPDEFLNIPFHRLEKDTLYGSRRFMINNYKEWVSYLDGEKTKEDFEGKELGGWGCGYFQLWNMHSNVLSGIPADKMYPSYPTAGESDILMLKRFHPDVKSVGKFDLDVAHLGNVGVNHDTQDDKTFFKW